MFFCAYGLIIQSDIDLSDVGVHSIRSRSDRRPDLAIKKCDRYKFAAKFQDNETAVHRDYGFYYRRGIALFEVHNGEEILVSCHPNIENKDLVRVLLNYPIACVMYQRGFFALHASAVHYAEKVMLFCGVSLAGKSSIIAKLLKSGAQMITEDTAVMFFKDRSVRIVPSFPLLKLSDEVRKYVEFSDEIGIQFNTEKTDRKGHILTSECFVRDSMRVDYCIFLNWCGDSPSIIKPSAYDAHARLFESSLNRYPLTREREAEILKTNFKFMGYVKNFVYSRWKNFKSLDNLEYDFRSMGLFD